MNSSLFFEKYMIGKTSCFMFFGLIFFSVFLSSVFHVVLLKWLFSSLCPPFVHPLSTCSLFFVLLFSRFFHLFLTFLNFLFWSKFIVHHLFVSLCKTLCQKIFILLDCSKTLFFSLLFSVKISVFSVSFFCCAFFRPIYFSMFCFSVSWKNGFSFLCNCPFFDPSFLVCFSFLVLFLCIQKLKNVFDGNDGKTIFCILSLISCFFWKDVVCAKNPFHFSTIFEIIVLILFSLHFKAQKNRQKTFMFLFFFSSFFVTFFLSTFFPFSLSSLFLLYCGIDGRARMEKRTRREAK